VINAAVPAGFEHRARIGVMNCPEDAITVSVGDEEETVVLVGRDGLLAAAFGPHPEPAQREPREVMLRRGEVEDSHGELIVEARNHSGQLSRGHPLRDQRMRKRADVRRALDQRGDVGGAANGRSRRSLCRGNARQLGPSQ